MPKQNPHHHRIKEHHRKQNALAATFVILAVLAFAASMAWQNSVLSRDAATLKKHVSALQAKSFPTDTSLAVPGTATQARVTLTPENLVKYNYQNDYISCRQTYHFNQDAATTTVQWTEPKIGLTLAVPFNPNWGNNQFAVNAYDAIENGIQFGPIDFGPDAPESGSCAWERNFRMTILPAMDENVLFQKIKASSSKASRIQLGNNAGIKYEQNDFCAYRGWIVMGNKHNYEFSMRDCGQYENQPAPFNMEKVAASLKFVAPTK